MSLADEVIDDVVVKNIEFETRQHRRGDMNVKVITFQVVASTHPARCGLVFQLSLPADPHSMTARSAQLAKVDLLKPLRARWDDRTPEIFEALPAVRLEAQK